MAKVQGIMEQCDFFLYDRFFVPPEKQLRDVENSSILRFFVNVQNKTKLDTNLQTASLLPHYNTFESRAMRVVISDEPPEFPEQTKMRKEADFPVTDDDDNSVFFDDTDQALGVVEITAPSGTQVVNVVDFEPNFDFNKSTEVVADLELGLDQLVPLLKEAHESDDGFAALSPDDNGVTLRVANVSPLPNDFAERVAEFGTIFLSVGDIESFIESLPVKNQPPKEQLDPNNGAGTLIGKFVYNTVTTLVIGEKEMIKAPTLLFPAGAGPYSETGKFTTHGVPDPMATFRFATPANIGDGQNFRVEIEIPDSDTLKEIQQIYGPLSIWVFLHGYLTRDVQ
jgi:hypothetical protein